MFLNLYVILVPFFHCAQINEDELSAIPHLVTLGRFTVKRTRMHYCLCMNTVTLVYWWNVQMFIQWSPIKNDQSNVFATKGDHSVCARCSEEGLYYTYSSHMSQHCTIKAFVHRCQSQKLYWRINCSLGKKTYSLKHFDLESSSILNCMAVESALFSHNSHFLNLWLTLWQKYRFHTCILL